MSRLDPSIRSLVWWGIPIAALAIALGFELGWGSGMRRVPPPETPVVPAPVSVGLLPEYAIAGGSEALQATAEHTLFNPTRRPAPPAAQSASGPTSLQRGQFVLTGTTVYGDKAVAYLREANGKTRTVRQGETVNGMLVASVTANGIRFTAGGESEELPLKIAAGPKTTVQPAVTQPGAGAGAGGSRGEAPAVPRNANAARNPDAPNAGALSIAERRRAARATEAARQADPNAPPAADARGAAGGGAASAVTGQESAWQQLYQRNRNRNAPK